MTLNTTIAEAEAHASICASQCGLPQTIYRNADSSGWWHTNALAPLLNKAELHMTVLPARYFH